jgi:hypothetical protein
MHMKKIASSAWHVLLNSWNITSNQNGPAYIQARRVRVDYKSQGMELHGTSGFQAGLHNYHVYLLATERIPPMNTYSTLFVAHTAGAFVRVNIKVLLIC